MIFRSSEVEQDGEEVGTEPAVVTAREVISIRQTQEEVGVARCPICQAVLVARHGRAGPYFFCFCATKPTKRAS